MEFPEDDYVYPDERKLNILLLYYAVFQEKTVAEAFKFLEHGEEVADHGQKKPICDEEIYNLYHSGGLNFNEIAVIFGVHTSTITRRYQKYVSRETEGQK